MSETISKWWYLDLQADFPELEIYTGGWGPGQELDLIELGERAETCSTDGLLWGIYSREFDRIFTCVAMLAGTVAQRYRAEGKELPAEWQPDIEYWEQAAKRDREENRSA